MKIEEIINNNRKLIANAICEHYVKYAHNSGLHELLLFADEAGKVSFKSVMGNSGNEIVFDDHYVIFSCGGYQRKAWSIIGDALTWLKTTEMFDVLEEIAEKKNIDIVDVTETEAETYIEEVYPELIDNWLKETHELYCDDEYAYAEECIDEFLEKLEDENQ